jgi:methionyl-tRNA synthetase
VVNMIGRYHEGRVPEPGELGPEEEALREACLARVDQALAQIDDMALTDAVGGVMETVGEINAYLERTAPWHRAKAGETDRVATILYTAAEALRLCAVLLEPVMPERMAELYRRLGWTPGRGASEDAAVRAGPGHGLSWGRLQPGTQVLEGSPLFPREV